MSNFYTQEQIDQIGVEVAEAINQQGINLKQFLQNKIDALEPAAPADPDGGTTTPSAGGTFLDDGREIKQKLILGSDFNFYANETRGQAAHGLNRESILNVSAIMPDFNGQYFMNNTTTISNRHYYLTVANSNINLNFVTGFDKSTVILENVKVLVTYLA